MEDLPLLIAHFVSRFENKFKMTVESITDEVFNAFMKYHWPGNVRELEHCIERAVILSRGEAITHSHIPPEIVPQMKKNETQLKIHKEKEPQEILNILYQTDWNKAKAARLLGISRKTLYQKIKKHNIFPFAPHNM